MTATPKMSQQAIVDEASSTGQGLGRLEANLDRLVNNFSEYRETVSNLKQQQDYQQKQMLDMSADFKSDMSKISDTIVGIADRIDNRKFSSSTWAAIIGVGLGFITLFTTASAFFVGAQINNAISPLHEWQAQATPVIAGFKAVEVASMASTNADARSETDRSEINRRLGRIEQQVADEMAQRREQFAGLNATAREVETQFKNITALTYLLYHKVTGDVYPIVPRESTMQ